MIEADSSSAPRRIVLPHSRQFLITAAFLCTFLLNFRVPTDPDFWWHLRTGQWMIETGSIPHGDIFSFTAFGQTWIAHEWLSELITYWIYSLGGYVTVVIVFSLVITLAYYLTYRLLLRLGVNDLLAIALVFVCFFVRPGVWAPRPQLFTFLMFVVFLSLLFRFKAGLPTRLWLLPLLMVLWVNLHAGYVIGLFLICVFIVGEGANRIVGKTPVRLKPLIVTGLCTLLATLVNPNTYEALLYPFTYAGSGNPSMRFITEWQSPDFHEYVWLGFALAIVGLMLIGRRTDGFDCTEGLLVAAFTLMSLQSVRHVILFALVCAPIFALRLKDRFPKQAGGASRSASSPLLSVLCVLLPLIVAVAVLRSPEAQIGQQPSTKSYPQGGVTYLKENPPNGNLFNTYGWGGYLIYTLYPDVRVFIDGRADVYGDRIMEDYSVVTRIQPGWREVLDRYQISTVLVEKESALAVLLESQSDWHMVYQGELEKVFVR